MDKVMNSELSQLVIYLKISEEALASINMPKGLRHFLITGVFW